MVPLLRNRREMVETRSNSDGTGAIPDPITATLDKIAAKLNSICSFKEGIAFLKRLASSREKSHSGEHHCEEEKEEKGKDVKKIFKTISGTAFLIPTTGTGAWESALTNTLLPEDRVVSFIMGQFSLLWVDQQKRLGFNVDVVESEWGHVANLEVLASKLAADTAHTIKAICTVHNETATGVTNNLVSIRKILDHYQHPALFVVDGVPSICALVVEAWGLKNRTQKEEWFSDIVTAVVVPPYIDSSEVVRRAWKRYNLSLGLGINKAVGKVFGIGHLSYVNDL